MSIDEMIRDDEADQARMDEAMETPHDDMYSCDSCCELKTEEELEDKLLCTACLDKLASYDIDVHLLRTALEASLAQHRLTAQELRGYAEEARAASSWKLCGALCRQAIEAGQMAETIEEVLSK